MVYIQPVANNLDHTAAWKFCSQCKFHPKKHTSQVKLASIMSWCKVSYWHPARLESITAISDALRPTEKSDVSLFFADRTQSQIKDHLLEMRQEYDSKIVLLPFSSWNCPNTFSEILPTTEFILWFFYAFLFRWHVPPPFSQLLTRWTHICEGIDTHTHFWNSHLSITRRVPHLDLWVRNTHQG